MGIGFIGAGKVGTAFGRYLWENGIAVSGYLGRHADKVAHACRSTKSKVFEGYSALAHDSPIVLITTRDDQIEGVCQAMCEAQSITADHLVGHMSGAHSSAILQSAVHEGAATFSLHPLQAFAHEDKALKDLPQTYFSLEGADSRISQVETILKKLGNPYFTIKDQSKSLYHLSACMFSNYLVTLLAGASDVLAAAGIDPQMGYKAMLPLIEGTIANIGRLGPAKALTGPIARGDVTTITQHLNALSSHELDALKSLYAFMGLKTLDLAVQDVLNDEGRAQQLRDVLAAALTKGAGRK